MKKQLDAVRAKDLESLRSTGSLDRKMQLILPGSEIQNPQIKSELGMAILEVI